VKNGLTYYDHAITPIEKKETPQKYWRDKAPVCF
jgi:hypothetical protein